MKNNIETEQLGFSVEGLNRIDEFYAHKVAIGKMAGIVLLISRHGSIVHFSAIGQADSEARRALQKDSIFRLYSMTKPVTATALMMLYEAGGFRLDDPVCQYIPEFADLQVLRTPGASITDTVPAIRAPTIRDLFRHTAGFLHEGGRPPRSEIGEAYETADLFNSSVSLEEMMQRLTKMPLAYQPGTRWAYSLAPDIQARLVEILSGMSFDTFLERRLLAPLGMTDTSHWVRPDKASRLVAVHWEDDNGKILPCDDRHGCADLDVRELNGYTRNNIHKGGSFGLTGTAEDYWRFAQMMLDGGEFNGRRLLRAATIRDMTRDHLGAVAIVDGKGQSTGIGWGLGFAVVKEARIAASLIPAGGFYWGGAANTLFWIDPKNAIVVVAMSQSMNEKVDGWPVLQKQIGAMVYGAMTE